METRQDFLNAAIAPRVSSRTKPECQSAASVNRVGIRRIMDNQIVSLAQEVLMETRQDFLNAAIAPRVSSRTKPECQIAASVNRDSIRRILDNQAVSFAQQALMETRQASLENVTIAPRVSSRTKPECKTAASVNRVGIRRILANHSVSFAQKALMETRQASLENVTIAPRVSSRTKPECKSASSVNRVSIRSMMDNRNVRSPPIATGGSLN